MTVSNLRFSVSDGTEVGGGSNHWIDQPGAMAPGQQAGNPEAPALVRAQVSSAGDLRIATAVVQPAAPTGSASGQASSDSATLLSATAGPAIAASQPVLILRNLQPWSQARVGALVAAGDIQLSWLPDIRAVAPEKLNVQREHQRDMLRFSNSIANTGANNWQVRRGLALDPSSHPELITYAESLGLDTSALAVTAQELLNPDGTIAALIPDAALSEFHPEHKHFHIGETAEFSLEKRNSLGGWDVITGLEVVKTTFCLIDVNQIQPSGSGDPDAYEIVKSPANANVYNDCFADVQGIQAGWIDRYSHSLPGQEVDITSLAAGTYRLKVNVNPSQWFLESDYSNNTSSVGFLLERNRQGQAFLTELPEFNSGIWFPQSPNGMG